MLSKPIDVFHGHIEKAELMIPALRILEDINKEGQDFSERTNHSIKKMKDEHPIWSLSLSVIKSAVELYTLDPKRQFEVLITTIRELTIIPAITATETYYKLVFYQQNGKELERTIGSIEDVNKYIKDLHVYDFLNNSDAMIIRKGFGFRHAIVHNLGKLDTKACKRIGIKPTHTGEDIADYLTPDGALEIIEAIKRMVEKSHEILTSD